MIFSLQCFLSQCWRNRVGPGKCEYRPIFYRICRLKPFSFFARHRVIIKTHTVHDHSLRNYLMISFQIAFQSESPTIWMFNFLPGTIIVGFLSVTNSNRRNFNVFWNDWRLHKRRYVPAAPCAVILRRHFCKVGKKYKASAVVCFLFKFVITFSFSSH